MLWSETFQRWAENAGLGQLRLLLAGLTAFVISLATGSYMIRLFRRRHIFENTHQPDHAGLDRIQSEKKQVPTMGGIMILAGIVAAMILWSDLTSAYVLSGLLLLLGLGGLGFVDDHLKRARPGKRGMAMRPKFIGQVCVALLVAYILYANLRSCVNATRLIVTFNESWSLDMGLAYIPWAVLVIVASSNAVNLADGLDGLAGGCTTIAAAALMVAGWATIGSTAHRAAAIAACLLAAGVVGATLGFLWYNVHPAQVFMGDTGSLALGGLLGYIALGMKMELPLVVAGGVLFADELSVALQIAGFKLTRRRLFPIAPLHHWFQLGPRWPEQKITARLWILAALGALVSLALVRWRWEV